MCLIEHRRKANVSQSQIKEILRERCASRTLVPGHVQLRILEKGRRKTHISGEPTRGVYFCSTGLAIARR